MHVDCDSVFEQQEMPNSQSEFEHLCRI